jgi:hypothetical protein
MRRDYGRIIATIFGCIAFAFVGAAFVLVVTSLPGAIDGGSDFYAAFGAALGIVIYIYWLGVHRVARARSDSK